MKLGWANGWRGIVALALLTGAAPTRGQTPQETSVTGIAKEEPKIVTDRIVKEDGQVLSESPSGIAVEIGTALDRGKSRKVCGRSIERGITRICGRLLRRWRMACDWNSWCGRICFSIRCASRVLRRRPAMLRRQRRCS